MNIKKYFLLVIICFLIQEIYSQWIPVNNGMGNVNVEAMEFLGNNIFTAVSQPISMVYLSTNGGLNWGVTSLTQTILSFTKNNNKIFAGSSGSGVYYSTNYGFNWAPTTLTNNSIWSMSSDGNNIYAGTYGSGVYLSTDNGLNWVQKGLNNRLVLSLVSNGGKTFAGLYLWGMYSTTNNGTSWISISDNMTVWSLAANLNNIYAGTRGDGLFASTNNGVNWIRTLSNVRLIGSLATSTNVALAGTDTNGIFVSYNSNENWIQRNEGLPNGISINSLLIIDNFAYAGTWGRGVYKRSIDELIAIRNITSEVPKEYNLSQNYPNPFNPVTYIKFSIPKTGFVKLAVYDVAGKEIEILVNSDLNPGTYKAEWNASEYPSGVYFYKLTIEGYTITRKMVLIK